MVSMATASDCWRHSMKPVPIRKLPGPSMPIVVLVIVNIISIIVRNLGVVILVLVVTTVIVIRIPFPPPPPPLPVMPVVAAAAAAAAIVVANVVVVVVAVITTTMTTSTMRRRRTMMTTMTTSIMRRRRMMTTTKMMITTTTTTMMMMKQPEKWNPHRPTAMVSMATASDCWRHSMKPVPIRKLPGPSMPVTVVIIVNIIARRHRKNPRCCHTSIRRPISHFFHRRAIELLSAAGDLETTGVRHKINYFGCHSSSSVSLIQFTGVT